MVAKRSNRGMTLDDARALAREIREQHPAWHLQPLPHSTHGDGIIYRQDLAGYVVAVLTRPRTPAQVYLAYTGAYVYSSRAQWEDYLWRHGALDAAWSYALLRWPELAERGLLLEVPPRRGVQSEAYNDRSVFRYAVYPALSSPPVALLVVRWERIGVVWRQGQTAPQFEWIVRQDLRAEQEPGR